MQVRSDKDAGVGTEERGEEALLGVEEEHEEAHEDQCRRS